MILIQPSTDHQALARMNETIHNQHVKMAPEVFKPYNRKTFEKEWETRVSDPDWRAFMAFDDGTEAGYVLVHSIDKPENAYAYASRILYIDQIYVDPDHRRKGIAKALVEEVFSQAKSMGIETVQLDHWSANNEARRFFARMGFSYFQEKMRIGLVHSL